MTRHADAPPLTDDGESFAPSSSAVKERAAAAWNAEDRWYVAALALGFAVSRFVFWAVGVRFSAAQLQIGIQYLDPELLRTRLLQSLWYLHIQPPLYNLFLGLVLKLSGGDGAAFFHAAYVALGLVFVLSVYFLLVGFSLPRPPAAAIALALSVSPAAILNENRLFYDYPVLVLLTVAALAAQRLARERTFGSTLALASLLAAVILTRSLYQLPFLVVALLPFVRLVRWKTLVSAAAVPIAAIVALSVKNAVMFGTYSTSSFLGENLAKVGIYTAPFDRRRSYVAAGDLDPVELVRPYAKLSAYDGSVRLARPRGVAAVDRPLTSNRKVNLNQWTYLSISRRRLHDDLHFIPSHPQWYARGVKLAGERFFWPPTYPSAITGPNKGVIGRWEALWEAGFYGSTPLANRVAFLLAAAYFGAIVFGLAVLARGRRADTAAIGFIWVVVVWTLLVGVFTDLGENYRSQLLVDPLVVVLVAVAAHRAFRAARAGKDAGRAL